jgi:hypothetical protein
MLAHPAGLRVDSSVSMRRRGLAPLGLTASLIFLGLAGVVCVGGGCTALVKFDDPPADEGDDDGGSVPDATDLDVTTVTFPDAAGDSSTPPLDGAPPTDAGDAATDAASDSGTDASDGGLLAECPTACTGYVAGDYWVCGWKREACISDPAHLNIVHCDDSTPLAAYTCPTGWTCVGSNDEDFCDPCSGQVVGAQLCDTSVMDPSHVAYLVTCNGASAPTYQLCADNGCLNCNTTVKTTTLPP